MSTARPGLLPRTDPRWNLGMLLHEYPAEHALLDGWSEEAVAQLNKVAVESWLGLDTRGSGDHFVPAYAEWVATVIRLVEHQEDIPLDWALSFVPINYERTTA